MSGKQHDAANRSWNGRRRSATPSRPWQLRVGFWLMLGVAAFFLLAEHRAHLAAGLRWLPWLVLLACPLIHVFAHRGHGGHSKHHPSPGSDADAGREAGSRHPHGGDLP